MIYHICGLEKTHFYVSENHFCVRAYHIFDMTAMEWEIYPVYRTGRREYIGIRG
jgi:hypothetical protein